MDYEEALKKVETYKYLIGKEITDKRTEITSTVDAVSLNSYKPHPKEDFNILNPYDTKYAAYLQDKDCYFVIVLDFYKSNGWGISISESSFNENYISRSK